MDNVITLKFFGFETKLSGVNPALIWPIMIGWLLICAAMLIALPLVSIWSLNTLFPVLAIPYGFVQWVAMAALMFLCFNRGSK